MVEEQQLGLRELLELAQTALEEGRHQEATISCRHVLRDYPEAATAMRLLGESYLEAGRTDEAGRAFEKVLTLDPFNILARVGLGVLAEDRGEDERAIGQFRLAWEAAPHLPQLRSELVRLYRKRYGVGGRLRMTRVALANLHARNEDLPRAIRQFEQLRGEDTDRIDVAVALAEARWRHCDDREAALACRQLLAAHPHLARPLLILAAIQGDDEALAAGAERSVDDLLTAARAYDPDAILARDLLALRPSPTLRRFVDAPVAMAPFDPAALDVAGTDELLGQRTSTQGEESFRWEDIAGGLTTQSFSAAAPPSPASKPAPTAEEDDVDALFAAIDRQLATNADGEPIDGSEANLEEAQTILLAEEDDPLLGWEDTQADEMTPAPDEPTAVERLTANWENIDNELAAARPTDDVSAGVTGMLSALGDMEADLVPFDVESDAEPEAEQTISFDPSKFSLPPLDGEDDDDLPLDLTDDELGEEIAPFNLDEAGPKVRTGGLTFTDLVRGEESGPLSYAAANQFDDATGDQGGARGDIASIFATRELSPLPEDRLLDLQVNTNEMSGLPHDPRVLPTVASTNTFAAPPAAPEPPVAPPAPVPTSEPTQATPPTIAAQDAPATGAAWHGPERRRDPDAAVSFESLLGADVARLEMPEANGYPDATRPLLSDDDLLAPDPTLAALASGEEEGMDNLFDRLRYRKQERIETGDLQPNRRLTAAEDAADVAGDPAADPEAPAFTPLSAEAAQLDDWIVSLDAPPREEDKGASAGDDWLAGLGGDAADEQPVWDLAPAPATAATDAGGARHDWGLDFTDGATAAPAPDHGDDTVIAERHAELPAAPAEQQVAWADEVPSPAPAAEDRDPANGTYTNGHREAEAPVAPPPQQFVARPTRPATAKRATEQLATLESMVAADPTNHFARLTLAVAYSGTQPEQALNEYRRLIRDAEDLIPEIIERLKEMIADGDAPSRTHRILGDAYMKLGQFDMAMAEFQRALSTRPRAARA